MSASFRYVLLAVFAILGYCFFSSSRLCSPDRATGDARSIHGQDRNSLLMDEGQCKKAFPLLRKEIDDVVSAGRFEFKRAVDDYTAQTHGRIKDGKLYVIATSDRMSQEMTHERDAVFNQIQRAITTSPTPLPDIVFTISVLDTPRELVWSFSRPSTPNNAGKYWVMPHFSYWSWPKAFIGSIDQALVRIKSIENDLPWEDKISKAVWRGNVHFNSVMNSDLRPKLMQITKGKSWADVEGLEVKNQGMTAGNSIDIHDFCKYKYIIHTEGVSYSGRLPFHQACASIILTPPLDFLMHNSHLIRPLLSTSLDLKSSSDYDKKEDFLIRWPNQHTTSEANIVFVDPKWSDLEETIMYFEKYPELAKRIARNQRKMFVERGNVEVAAEVCYWRALIRGWSQVARYDEEDWRDADGGVGMRWETFMLKGTMDKTAV